MATMKDKLHMDDMKRVTGRDQDYFYHNISNTPFTIGIVLPAKYGKFRVSGGVDLQNNIINVTELFPDESWKVHPDWIYCQHNNDETEDKLETSEKFLRHFLERLGDESISSDWEKCDMDLVQALILDAKVTGTFTEKTRT